MPYNSLGMNQNGWAPGQKKVVVYTSTSNISAPLYSVTGPQAKSGTMTSWGTQWGLYFYTANVTTLTNEGRYVVSANGLSQRGFVQPAGVDTCSSFINSNYLYDGAGRG